MRWFPDGSVGTTEAQHTCEETILQQRKVFKSKSQQAEAMPCSRHTLGHERVFVQVPRWQSKDCANVSTSITNTKPPVPCSRKHAQSDLKECKNKRVTANRSNRCPSPARFATAAALENLCHRDRFVHPVWCGYWPQITTLQLCVAALTHKILSFPPNKEHFSSDH